MISLYIDLGAAFKGNCDAFVPPSSNPVLRNKLPVRKSFNQIIESKASHKITSRKVQTDAVVFWEVKDVIY